MRSRETLPTAAAASNWLSIEIYRNHACAFSPGYNVGGELFRAASWSKLGREFAKPKPVKRVRPLTGDYSRAISISQLEDGLDNRELARRSLPFIRV